MTEENKAAENVSAGEAASAPSAKRNKRKLAGIIGVVAAVVVVAGAGSWYGTTSPASATLSATRPWTAI